MGVIVQACFENVDLKLALKHLVTIVKVHSHKNALQLAPVHSFVSITPPFPCVDTHNSIAPCVGVGSVGNPIHQHGGQSHQHKRQG